MPSSLLVIDAGPLIALSVGGVLPQTIDLYKKLSIPQAVLDECLADPHAPGAAAIANALLGKDIYIVAQIDISPLDAAYALGRGSCEAAVLSYAAQHQHIALVDDRKAREIAQRMQIRVVGSGAILLALKISGQIKTIAPVLDVWRAHGYFVASSVVNDLLRRAGELDA